MTNLGDPINGWDLVWTSPSGQQVTQAWNATITPSGNQVTAVNASYNAAIATGGYGLLRLQRILVRQQSDAGLVRAQRRHVHRRRRRDDFTPGVAVDTATAE